MENNLNQLLFLVTPEAKELEDNIKLTKIRLLNEYKAEIETISNKKLGLTRSNVLYQQALNTYHSKQKKELEPLIKKFEGLKKNFSVKEYIKRKKK